MIRWTVIAAALLLFAPSALAQEDLFPETRPRVEVVEEVEAFERDFALGTYYSSWSGSYDSGGVGFRLRWEPLDEGGIEGFAEILDVDVPSASRFDVPLGFSVYIPITLLDGLRIRPLVGLCTMFSFVESDTPGVPGSEDVRFGVHAGVGAELAVSQRWSVFVDAVYQGYFGHEREVEAWTSALSEDIGREDSFQLGLGLQLHL